MLVLSRRTDEKIVLPTVPAVIKVIASQAGLVRLGIAAPTDIPILREELTRPGAFPHETESASPRSEVRNQLRNLTQSITRLRSVLPNAGPDVRAMIDSIVEDIQVLHKQVAALSGREQAQAFEILV